MIDFDGTRDKFYAYTRLAYLRKLEPRIFSYLPTELYADVFAMGTVDEFCGGADGGAVVIMGVGEVDEQGEW